MLPMVWFWYRIFFYRCFSERNKKCPQHSHTFPTQVVRDVRIDSYLNFAEMQYCSEVVVMKGKN